MTPAPRTTQRPQSSPRLRGNRTAITLRCVRRHPSLHGIIPMPMQRDPEHGALPAAALRGAVLATATRKLHRSPPSACANEAADRQAQARPVEHSAPAAGSRRAVPSPGPSRTPSSNSSTYRGPRGPSLKRRTRALQVDTDLAPSPQRALVATLSATRASQRNPSTHDLISEPPRRRPFVLVAGDRMAMSTVCQRDSHPRPPAIADDR